MPQFTLIETTVSDKAEALMPLLRAHAQELADASALKNAAPNWEAYRALENTGALLAIVAYAGEEIAGYATAFIGGHLHHSGLRYAHSDALYVAPPHRRGGLGLALIREAERVARAKGARLMLWHAKPDTALEKILPRIGYRVEETAFCKEI
ncbi:MAG TPA: GNAT family N-acetyltransferase [Gallionellaceae bacterium]|nr:GNAT family N-acetyltransferase [Gallionellaceae bacterium]